MTDVLFVSMPFGPIFNPSIGLSLLQSALTAAGIPSRARYFSIRFAEILGTRLYVPISQSLGVPVVELAGEWIFAGALGDRPADADAAYEQEVLRTRAAWSTPECAPRLTDARIRGIVGARRLVPAFLDWCTDQVIAERPRVVGFTSSFQQHAASLALARRLKAALPDLRILMGGANCEAVMGAETLRQFPFVDAVVSGEADLIIVDLLQRLLGGRAIDDIEGVMTPSSVARSFAAGPDPSDSRVTGVEGRFGNAPVVRDMDALPYPDYTDYMRQFEASPIARRWQPNVLFESSRGCWWGAKAHCTFCGLNGSTMAFRSKSATRALDELRHVARTYPGSRIQVVDNILDMTYFGDLLPDLARETVGFDLFYETKANLKKEQVRQLAAAGVARIQPGIESFSDEVLALMRKGVSWMQNVQLLKWCKELGVRPYWNWLWGFPGEAPADYARMTHLIKWLTHLPAPVSAAGVRLDRFSPNFDQADRLGFDRVRPVESYRHVYPDLPEAAVGNLAYYFNFDYADGRRASEYARPLLRQVASWRRVHPRSELVSMRTRDRLCICDFRPAAVAPVTVLDGLDRLLYEACDGAAHVRRLASLAGPLPLPTPDPRPTRDPRPTPDPRHPTPDLNQREAEDCVAARLQPLVDRGLMVTDGHRYLALAIPIGEYRPPAAVQARVRRIIRALDRRGGTHTPRRVRRARIDRRRARA